MLSEGMPEMVALPSSPSIEVFDRRSRSIDRTRLFQKALLAMGYSDLKKLPCGALAGLLQFNFTHGLLVGLDTEGYERRYCFEHESDARKALEAWNGLGHPSGPWIKCKGAGLDLLNPALSG